MTGRHALRLRIDPSGSLEVVDPGWECMPLLTALDPHFVVRTAELPSFVRPRVTELRRVRTGIPVAALAAAPLEELWTHHDAAMQAAKDREVSAFGGGADLLALKAAIARRLLRNCVLCAHRCGVDRAAGATGICRLDSRALVAESFVHIAEEPEINPSLLISLAGCGLRCRYCQQHGLLDPPRVSAETLEPSFWERIDSAGARSLSFVGGNPDESLSAIMDFLSAVPEQWSLPIVWNCHAYSSVEALRLLNGVVDAYLPDFKYGNDKCARKLSGAPGYPAIAATAINSMRAQGVPVIARILVLPGHLQCCHEPTLDVLAGSSGPGPLLVSVRGQYSPDWRVTGRDGTLARRPTTAEVESVRYSARTRGLRVTE